MIDNGSGMITVLIWKKACIDLFISYFNIELKRTKLTSHTDTKHLNMSGRYWLRDNSPGMEKGMHWSIYYICQHWIKKNNINVPHTPNLWICLNNNCCGTCFLFLLLKHPQIFPRWKPTFSKRQLTVGRKWHHGGHERLDIVLSEFYTSGVYVWAKSTLCNNRS